MKNQKPIFGHLCKLGNSDNSFYYVRSKTHTGGFKIQQITNSSSCKINLLIFLHTEHWIYWMFIGIETVWWIYWMFIGIETVWWIYWMFIGIETVWGIY